MRKVVYGRDGSISDTALTNEASKKSNKKSVQNENLQAGSQAKEGGLRPEKSCSNENESSKCISKQFGCRSSNVDRSGEHKNGISDRRWSGGPFMEQPHACLGPLIRGRTPRVRAAASATRFDRLNERPSFKLLGSSSTISTSTSASASASVSLSHWLSEL